LATQILTLSENTVRRRGMVAEHGVAFLVQTSESTILFDTGQGHALTHNARHLGVDLRSIQSVVLSHGHFDHTGGLHHLLESIGSRPVLAHPDALAQKYSVRKGEVRSIGMPQPRDVLERSGATFCLHKEPLVVAPGITATGFVPRVTDFEHVGAHFQTGTEGELRQDTILDDQSVIVETAGGPVVILGCAHAGLINTLLYATKLTGSNHFCAVIGGTHLVDADEERMRRTLEALASFDIEQIAPCHCTGFKGQVALSQAFGKQYVENNVGSRFEFGD
jgi:7,8-dihydropterin-6-yl-methyl-4-(beta-D-ribofuranosyl)aminobenzene 5'-phosphate synthase